METFTVNGLASRSSTTAKTPEVPERPKRGRFSMAEKRRIVTTADVCMPGTLGALLQREGIDSSLLARWRLAEASMNRGYAESLGKISFANATLA